MVAEQVIGSSETGLMIVQYLGTSYYLYNYIENNNNNLKLIDIKGISTETVYILLINLVLPQVRFLEVSFIGGQVSIIEKILKRPDLLVTELLGARLQVNREFYLFGTRSSYSTAMNVGSGASVGFFTYSADYNICGAPGTTATIHISEGTAFLDSLIAITGY